MLNEYLARLTKEYEVAFTYDSKVRELWVRVSKDGLNAACAIDHKYLSDEECIVSNIKNLVKRYFGECL